MPHTLRHRGGPALSKRIDGAGASRFAGGHSANPQHGDAWRKHLSGHALQLIRPKLRVEKIDQFLPEKRRHDLLGCARKFEVRGGLLDGYGPGTDGPRGENPAWLALGRWARPSFQAL